VDAQIKRTLRPNGDHTAFCPTPYLLRYDEQADEWTLQSGFDGDELLARPSITFIMVDADVVRRAEEAT